MDEKSLGLYFWISFWSECAQPPFSSATLQLGARGGGDASGETVRGRPKFVFLCFS
jgi:hypothetical protein